MPHKSLRQIRKELQHLQHTDRFVDARLELQAPDGESLLVVGGCWDHFTHRYVDRPCATRVLKLKVSQVEVGRAVAKYIAQRLAGDDSRVALMELIGNRGGGKTFFGAVLMVVIALALPGSYQIGASLTSKQNRELKQGIKQVCGPFWKSWISNDISDPRDPRTEFATRGTVLWLTAKNPKALRQALLSFEHVCINEGQDQREVMFTNAISAIRNTGGIVTVLTNPPQEGSGDWVAILYQGIEAGSQDGLAFILRAEDNDAVNQPTRGKIERLLRLVNPDAADRDGLGLISLSGNVGYPGFTRRLRVVNAKGRWVSGHVGEPINLGPYAWVDITKRLTAEKTGGEGFDYVAGGDFQTEPGSCAGVGKFFETPDGILLWVKEFIATNGTEADLTMALTMKGYFPGSVDYDGKPAASCLIIGDATGARQNAEHRKRDPYSFTRLRADGWTVRPPALYGPKRTPWNPLVTDSRKQMKLAFITGVIVLSSACIEAQAPFPSLVESFARAKVNANGKFEKRGHYTHGPDGVRYMAWWGLPKSVAPVPESPAFDKESFELLEGIKLF